MEQADEKKGEEEVETPIHQHGIPTLLTDGLHEPIETEPNTATSPSPDTPGDFEKDTAVNSYAPSARQSLDGRSNKDFLGVDVLGAQQQFAELQRHISGLSEASRKLSRQQSTRSRKSLKHDVPDIEKAVSSESSEEPFDLEDTLRGNKRLEDESGIKAKQIGVIWRT